MAVGVRLPQPAACLPVTPLLPAAARLLPATVPPVDRRARQRAERARYQAQCRMVMAF